MGKGNFRPPPYISKTPEPILIKLETYNYFPEISPYTKFNVNLMTMGGLSKW